jgi:hypothetical protein
MNLPIHIISGATGAAILYNWTGAKNSFGFFCFASFLDVDHYIYYILKFHNLNIRKAFEYFDFYKHTPRFCLCILHTVEFSIFVGLIAYLSHSLFIYACLLGILFHYIGDIIQGLYYRRMDYRWWSVVHYYWVLSKGYGKKL